MLMSVFELDNEIDEDRERYNRLNRRNLPEYPAGQDVDVQAKGLFENNNLEDVFKTSVENYNKDITTNNPEMYQSQYRGQHGYVLNGGYNPANSYPNYWQHNYSSPMQRGNDGVSYEKIEEYSKKAAKGIWQILSTVDKTTPLFWYETFWLLGKVGISILVFGIVLLCFGFDSGYDVIIAGVLSVGVGFGEL